MEKILFGVGAHEVGTYTGCVHMRLKCNWIFQGKECPRGLSVGRV